MFERNDIIDHINQFNKYITSLQSLEVKIEVEDQVIIYCPLYKIIWDIGDYTFNWKEDVNCG